MTLKICLSFGASAPLAGLSYNTNDLSLSRTNLLQSNILAGAGITIAKGPNGRLTLSSTGGGGGTNFDGIVVTNNVTLISGKVLSPPDGGGGGKTYFGVSGNQSGVFENAANGKVAVYDSDSDQYQYSKGTFVYDAVADENTFTAARTTFRTLTARDITPTGNNTYNIGFPDAGGGGQLWKDGWFGNTLNTTGLCAGITYVSLTSGSCTNSTNNFTVMMPNGSARTNWLNTAAGVGAIQIVKDDRGTADGTNIIVKATSGTINSSNSYTINNRFGAVWFQSDGTNWTTIAKF